MAELKLVVGADVRQAEKALKSLTGDVQASASKIDSTYKRAFSSVGSSISKIPAATRPAVVAVSRLGDTLETLRAKLLAKQSFLVTEKDITRIAVLNNEIRELQSEIIRVKNIGATGFDSLGNQITKTAGTFNGLAAGAQKGFTALRFLANVIPGIGIAGLISLLSDAVVGLFKASQGFDDAAISAAKFAQAIKDAKTNIEDFFSSELDVTKLRNKLRFGEGTALIKANFSLDKQANEQIINEANQQIDDTVDRIGQLRSNAAFFLSTKGRQLLDLFPDDAAIPDNLIDELEDQDKKVVQELKVQGTRLESLRKERNKARDRNALLEVQSQIDLRDALKKENDKRLEDLKKFIDKAKQLASELEKIGFLQPKFSFFDTFQEQLIKARKVFDDFNKKHFRLNPDFFKITPAFSEPRPEHVQDALNPVEQGIKQGIIKLPPIPLEVTLTPNFDQNLRNIINDPGFTKIFEDIGRQMPSLDMEAPAGFNFNVMIANLRKFFGVGQDITKEGLSQLASEFRKGVDNINNILKGLAVGGIGAFAESLGAALAGGDIQNIFKGFVNILADGLSAIGKQMIALSPVIAGLKAALKSLNPALLLPAGVALVAIGAALRATVSKGITGFAQGGLVFGPTVGLVGEGVGTSRSNPEVIAPLDQLKSMLGELGGNSAVRVEVVGRMRGRDLILQTVRTGKSQRRLGS